MEEIAPLSCWRLRRRIAPRTIYRIDPAVTNPSMDAAAIWSMGTFQMVKARIQVVRKATGIAFVAGHLKRTISANTVRIGNNARNAMSA
jgi:hypothetical protein